MRTDSELKQPPRTGRGCRRQRWWIALACWADVAAERGVVGVGREKEKYRLRGCPDGDNQRREALIYDLRERRKISEGGRSRKVKVMAGFDDTAQTYVVVKWKGRKTKLG